MMALRIDITDSLCRSKYRSHPFCAVTIIVLLLLYSGESSGENTLDPCKDPVMGVFPKKGFASKLAFAPKVRDLHLESADRKFI